MQKEKNKNTDLYNLVLGNYLLAEDRQIVIGGFLSLVVQRANDL